jgi:arsenate reductase
MTSVIYHNPACGTSRQVLAILREAGESPRVVQYLKAPPDRDELVGLLRRMGLRARELLRRRGTPFNELGLGDPELSEDALVDAMLRHPVLIERPIVVTPLGVRLCRPPERVREILPQA